VDSRFVSAYGYKHPTQWGGFESEKAQLSSNMKTFPVVILGGGMAAGYAAKEFVAQGGAKGDLAIVGAEPTLPYERPPLSKGFLAGRDKLENILISNAEFYREHGIALQRSFEVRKVDFKRRRLIGPGGKALGFGKLLIATGSTVRKLRIPGANSPNVHYLRRMEDSRGIAARMKKGKRAVVIGSGFIGMEVASVLAANEVQTTMVFPDDRVWKRLFTAPVSAFFEKQFAGHGVQFVRNEKVVGLAHGKGETRVMLASGGSVAADFVVAGIGVTPAVELFARTPLAIENGIKVNELLETSVTDVWAAGDVASYPNPIFQRRMRVEHWDNAVEQGRYAMRNVLGKLQPFVHVPYFFSDVFDMSYEYWGDGTDHDRVVYRGNMEEKQLSVWWLRKNTLCAALIMNRPGEERDFAARWIMRQQKLDAKKLQAARQLKSLDTTFGPED
jgi:NADPH-dependent 2,4-dienoyl-CoA reductase/sulfur reductase-like enzyme